jgi:(S)-ureidoglycine-glyoxylate aminotransferase
MPPAPAEEAVRRMVVRKRVESGIRDAGDARELTGSHTVIRSNYLDLAMLLDYWGERRLNHHTEATSMLYAAMECARILLLEGIDAAIERHAHHGAAMLAGVEALGLDAFGDAEHKMHNVLGVEIPSGIDGERVRDDLLHDFDIEIGSSFGPLQGRIWRIGTMGYNARTEAVLITLSAFERVLHEHGVTGSAGDAVDAAIAFYECS